MLLDRRAIPEPSSCGVARLALAHAFVLVLGGTKLEVEAHLVLHLAIVPRAKEVVANAQPESAQPAHRGLADTKPAT